MPYDELIKRLHRYSENCVAYKLDADFADAVQQAADAIENTSKAYQMMAEAYEAEVTKRRWIPVTEQLPEEKINQNTLDFEYVLCATTFGDVRPYKFGRRIGQGEPHFWNGGGYVDTYITYWQPLPKPPKGE